MKILFSDFDPVIAFELEKTINLHSFLVFETNATVPEWTDVGVDGRRAFIRPLADHCNALFVQNLWLEKLKVELDLTNFKTGHMPFVSHPKAWQHNLFSSATVLQYQN
jgi:hypothetical protein